MLLHVFDENFNLMGMLDNYISLQWKESYHDRGSFTLIAVDSKANIDLLQMGRFIYQAGKRTAMIIKYAKKDSETSRIDVNGHTTLDLLDRRVIFPVQTIYNIESGMYALVERFLKGSESDRNISNFTTARILNGLQGFPYILDTQYTGTNLLEALTALGEESGLGFYMEFDWRNKQHVFTVYQGLSRTSGQKENIPAVFSAEFGNLKNMILMDDMSIFKNVAYVAGAGEGTARKHIVVGNAKGLDRYELYVDARDLQQEYTDDNGKEVSLTDAQYIALLQSRGLKKLNDHLRAKSFNGEVDAFDFGKEYYLGDEISAKSTKYNARIDARIMEYTEVTENNKTKLSVSLGTPEISLLQEVKSWL